MRGPLELKALRLAVSRVTPAFGCAGFLAVMGAVNRPPFGDSIALFAGVVFCGEFFSKCVHKGLRLSMPRYSKQNSVILAFGNLLEGISVFL